jgi:hypothetical protein
MAHLDTSKELLYARMTTAWTGIKTFAGGKADSDLQTQMDTKLELLKHVSDYIDKAVQIIQVPWGNKPIWCIKKN